MVVLGCSVALRLWHPPHARVQRHANAVQHVAQLGMGAGIDAFSVVHSAIVVVGHVPHLGVRGPRIAPEDGRASARPELWIGAGRGRGADGGAGAGAVDRGHRCRVVALAGTKARRGLHVGAGFGHTMVDSRRRGVVDAGIAGTGRMALVGRAGFAEYRAVGAVADDGDRLGAPSAIVDSRHGQTARGPQMDPMAGPGSGWIGAAADVRDACEQLGHGHAGDRVCMRGHLVLGMVLSSAVEGHEMDAVVGHDVVCFCDTGPRVFQPVTFSATWA